MEPVNLRRLPDDWTGDEEALLDALDEATATPVYVSYQLAGEWFQGVQAVLDDVDRLIAGRPEVALALIEHAVIRLDRAAGSVDDSDGGMVEACELLASLHAAASERAGMSESDRAARVARLNALDLRPFELG